MKISHRLALIVCLTLVEVSFTVWTAFQLAKGADFHRLNFLHLKYETVFSQALRAIKDGRVIQPDHLEKLIRDVRQQPIDCLAAVNAVDRYIMDLIDTSSALDTCVSDLATADSALESLGLFVDGRLPRPGLIAAMERTSREFVANSIAFEMPIARTVEFLLETLIPLIIAVSLLNIFIIAYLSRKISLSLKHTQELLAQEKHEPLAEQLKDQVPGEIRELLSVAETRIRRDFRHREMNALLETQVAERTASLTQANDELAQFAYRASHDLKAPLSSTKGLSKLIRLDIGDGNLAEAEKNADRITAQMESLERLVVDILSLARADLANDHAVTVSVKQIVEEIEQRHGAEIALRGVQLKTDIQETKKFAVTKIRLTQIIENLVSNAIKYYDPKKVEPYVFVRWRVEGGLGHLSIEDNGRGIPNSRHGELYAMFKRFHPEEEAGSGLGLAIVKKHVDRMNASIACRSAESGTRFDVTFANAVAASGAK